MQQQLKELKDMLKEYVKSAYDSRVYVDQLIENMETLEIFIKRNKDRLNEILTELVNSGMQENEARAEMMGIIKSNFFTN